MILFGAGGIGVVVLDALTAQGKTVDYCVDDGLAGQTLMGVPIISNAEFDSADGPSRDDHEMILCIGNCNRRAELARQYPGRWGQAIHTSTVIADSASVGQGTMIFHGSVIQARAKLGEHIIVNTAASIDHDCVIGNHVHIAPHSTICGLVTVHDGADIGAATTIIPSVTVGAGAVIGAGAVVLKDVPPNTVSVGVPARVIKTLK